MEMPNTALENVLIAEKVTSAANQSATYYELKNYISFSYANLILLAKEIIKFCQDRGRIFGTMAQVNTYNTQ